MVWEEEEIPNQPSTNMTDDPTVDSPEISISKEYKRRQILA